MSDGRNSYVLTKEAVHFKTEIMYIDVNFARKKQLVKATSMKYEGNTGRRWEGYCHVKSRWKRVKIPTVSSSAIDR